MQRRNRTLSGEAGAGLFEVIEDSGRLKRYAKSLLKTVSIIRKEKPSVVFVPNPSLILSFAVLVLCKIIKTPIVVDAHTAGIYPFEGKSRAANWLAAIMMRHADITIVTNGNLAASVTRHGGRPFVLPDPMPVFPTGAAAKGNPGLKGTSNILYVCTFSPDEPYADVIRAAALLDNNTFIYVSGNPKKMGREAEHMPDNVIFTGYLPEDEYIRLLFAVDAVVVLTTLEDCLLCGAYEAVAAEKPLIITGTPALRSYFSRGALYTGNTPEDLADKINMALAQKDFLHGEMAVLQRQLKEQWTERKRELEGLLEGDFNATGRRRRSSIKNRT